MGNLLHFPTSYVPTFEEMNRLESWQRAIDGWRRDLHYEHTIKRFDAYHIMISREKFHQGVRSRWLVYIGFKDSRLFRITQAKTP
jgi:hypothetical protein